MKAIKVKVGLAVSALALITSPAMAQMTDKITVNGFASFVAGKVIDDDELAEDNFRGFDGDLGFQENSLFAVQMRADLLEGLSATAQVVAKGQDDFEPTFKWAYLAYELNSEWTVKMGRFRTPYFMYSDFLDVGYAYHWISPPDSVYNLGGFDSIDGVAADYTTDIGSWTSQLTLTAGRTSTTVDSAAGENDIDLTGSWAVAWSMNYDWLTLRAVHSESDVTLGADAFDQIAGGLVAFGVSQEAISNMLLESDRGTFDGFAVSLDFGSFFAVTEYAEVAVADSFSSDPSKRWYVSGGYRFGDWTVYGTFENVKADIQESERDAIINQLDQIIPFLPTPAQQAAAVGLQGGVGALFGQSEVDEDIGSLGLRYNFHPSAAAKVEIMQKDDDISDTKPRVLSFAIDIIF